MNANLLTDNVFGILTPDQQHRRLSLPGLLAALARGEVESLTGVQRHQIDAFHIFLCYLSAAALECADQPDPPQEEDRWKQSLRLLSDYADDCAWTLAVDGPGKPAFMQPPIPSNDLAGYKPKAATPDELDVLQTAKNHDLKASRLTHASPEDWALALISSQTMSGFLGQGNYGISRMNGGFGVRVCVGVNRTLQPSERWREDLARLNAQRTHLTQPPWPFRDDGHLLLWTLPWDGQTSIGLETLHPYFIEICRLVRLVSKPTGIAALGKPTKAARIAGGKELAGNVGDGWTPIHRKKGSALTPSARGFHPDMLRDLIITQTEYLLAPMQELPSGDGAAIFHASALVRGQGTTDGFHEVNIPIDSKAKRLLLLGGEPADHLGRRSEWAIDAARNLRSRVLRPALFTLLEGGPEGWPDTNRREAGQWTAVWLGEYDEGWADAYFPWLWSSIEVNSEPDARADWVARLSQLAENILEHAFGAAPQRTGRRYRAQVRASGLFRGALYKHFQEEMAHGRH
ncbi:type I-E CRISPR-associated protein Cse1/CasA [Alkalilimnicola ehrlichii MLHE-1]|uniref:CRISPR-associated protein, Cse1 family n=1 Tax=Alkalilimnicola ehrlichii (strain ATCC BAA-1101 / DSM 17681 / MLHE-1) TaxID=187272 RepID=Q0AA30_ALKEH|nr:type I-E CRISPR-associated protein Cse1/CasA [Alkalilimnicola ehrlichii]ABI56307.1 CRISPR-associated protein, Cse1 family [Alkalilimnicola ehrlichii MLHE-1]